MKNKIVIFIAIFLFVMGCKPTSYLHHEVLPDQETDQRMYPLSLLQINNQIDVVLVIDNSGSMQPIQNNVIQNARLFFEQFAKEAYVDWKLGIISTDKTETPYLGFNTSFDASLIDEDDPTSFDRVVQQFQQAVNQLGTDGSAYEYTFFNLKRMLDQYDRRGSNSFLRSNAHLVVIMISDEKEQSYDDFRGIYDAEAFYNHMLGYVPSDKKLRFYGAIKHQDLKGCSDARDWERWAGSQFDKIIKVSEGFVSSACVADFGNELAKIGKDIASLVGLPSLLLKRRPKLETLQVYYEDELLTPGPRGQGGQWFYEEITNTINFYNLDFVRDLKNDRFRIEFEVDDGVNRD